MILEVAADLKKKLLTSFPIISSSIFESGPITPKKKAHTFSLIDDKAGIYQFLCGHHAYHMTHGLRVSVIDRLPAYQLAVTHGFQKLYQ